MAATTKLTTKNQKDKMIGLTPNGAFYMFPGMDYSTLGNGVLEMPMTPPNPAMGTEFKNQIVTNQEGQNLFPGLMTYVKGDKYQQYKHARYGGYGMNDTAMNSGVSGSESASDVQTTLATWAKLNNLDYDKVVEQFSALDNKEQMQAYTSIKAKLRQQELQSMMTPSMGMTDTSMQVAKDGGCIDCQEQFPQAQNLNWFYKNGGLKKYQGLQASQIGPEEAPPELVKEYESLNEAINAILAKGNTTQNTGKTPVQVKDYLMSTSVGDFLGNRRYNLDQSCKGPYCTTAGSVAMYETYPESGIRPTTGGDNFRDMVLSNPAFGITSEDIYSKLSPGSLIQNQVLRSEYTDPVTKELKYRSVPSYQSAHNYYVYDVKELENGRKRVYTVQNPGSGPQILKEYDIDKEGNLYRPDTDDIAQVSGRLKGQSRPALMYYKGQDVWSNPELNELISKRQSTKDKILESNPKYFDIPVPTRFDTDYTPGAFISKYSTSDQGPYVVNAEGDENINLSESRIPEILNQVNDPEYKKMIMKDYNISNDEYNAMIKTMMGQYMMESQGGTDYQSGLKLPENKLFSYIMPKSWVWNKSLGPFQTNYGSLSDKTRKLYPSDERDVLDSIYDPVKSSDIAMRFLAENVSQLRNRAKSGNKENLTRENYLDFLPYLINQQGWLARSDKSSREKKGSILGEGVNKYVQGVKYYGDQLVDYVPMNIDPVEIKAAQQQRDGGEAFPQANTYPLTWAGYSGTQYASGGEAFPQAQTYLPYDRKGETRPNFMFKEGGDQFGGQFDPSMIYNVMKRGGLNINPKKKRGGSLSGMEFKDYLMKNGGLMKFQDKNSQPGVSDKIIDYPFASGSPEETAFTTWTKNNYADQTGNYPGYLYTRPGQNDAATLWKEYGQSWDKYQNTGKYYGVTPPPNLTVIDLTNQSTTANTGTTSTQSTATNTGTTGTGPTTSTQSGTPTTTTTTTGTQSGTSGAGTSGSDNKQTTSPYTNFDYAKYANLAKNQQVAAGVAGHIKKNPLLNALTMPYHAFNVGQQTVQGITGGAKEIGKFATNVGRIPSMIMANGGMPSLPSFQTDGGVGGNDASNPSNPDAACECKDKDGNVTKNMKPCSDGTCPSCDGDGSCPDSLGYNHVGAQQAMYSLSAMGNFLQDINAGKQQRKDEKLSAFNTLNIAQPQQNTSQMMGKALLNPTQGNLNQPNMFAQVQKPGLSMQSTSLQEGTMPKSWMNPNSPLQPINARIGGTMFESGGEYDLDIDTVRELIKAGWDVELI